MSANTCPNCFTPATGAYCAACGQAQDVALTPVGKGLQRLLTGLFDMDNRAIQTLRLLATRPGELTRRWGAGQRASQTHPLRLYLAVSTPVIALMSLAGFFDRPDLVAQFGADGAARFELFFPLVNLAAPLLFLLWLKLCFPRQLLHLHLILALHQGAAVVLFTSPMLVLLPWPDLLDQAQLLAQVGLAGYLAAAMRRLFVIGWPRAIASALLVSVAYLVSLSSVGLLFMAEF